MELSRDQHAALRKMASYFDTIETVAERMGADADSHAGGFRLNHRLIYGNIKNYLSTIASVRQDVFRRTGKAPAGNLTVIVNEDRF